MSYQLPLQATVAPSAEDDPGDLAAERRAEDHRGVGGNREEDARKRLWRSWRQRPDRPGDECEECKSGARLAAARALGLAQSATQAGGLGLRAIEPRRGHAGNLSVDVRLCAQRRLHCFVSCLLIGSSPDIVASLWPNDNLS
jgi:hypothetical protein